MNWEGARFDDVVNRCRKCQNPSNTNSFASVDCHIYIYKYLYLYTLYKLLARYYEICATEDKKKRRNKRWKRLTGSTINAIPFDDTRWFSWKHRIFFLIRKWNDHFGWAYERWDLYHTVCWRNFYAKKQLRLFQHWMRRTSTQYTHTTSTMKNGCVTSLCAFNIYTHKHTI